MTLGFWPAQPGLAHGEYVAVLLAESRAAVCDEVTSACKSWPEVQHYICRS